MVFPQKFMRMAAAELLAYAVKDIFPETLIVDSEISDIDFYYDFVIHQPISDDTITLFEEKLRSLIKEDLLISPVEMMRENAITFFLHHQQPYKAALLENCLENIVKLCRIGQFFDVCAIPEEVSSSDIGVIKILSIKRCTSYIPAVGDLPVLRIHAVSFPDKMALKKFLKRFEAAKKRDHRVLGQEMNLFGEIEGQCPGCWTWYPKGEILRATLIDLWKRVNLKQRFQLISTQSLAHASFFKKVCTLDDQLEHTGPLFDFFLEGEEYVLSSSQNPFHAKVFQSRPRTFIDLPVRFSECSDFYSSEKNSRLYGLLNPRTYTSDIANIFCSSQQLLDELISSLQFINKTIMIFGFEYHWYLGTRGRKIAGKINRWEKAQELLIEALNTCGFDYLLDNSVQTIYGPRVDVRLVDALGREWKGPFLAVDLNLPEKLGLCYQGIDGQMQTPLMISRSLFGSLERFIAILIEHYAGLFPLWLAPEQVKVIPVSEKNAGYAGRISAEIERFGFRVGTDYRNENLGTKIHAAERENIPYLIIVGEKEERNRTITVRSCGQEAKKMESKLDVFLRQISEESKFNFDEAL